MSVSHTAAGGQFIAGNRVAAGGDIIRSLCAATGEPTGYDYYQATPEEAHAAAQAAAAAFPAYSQTDSAQRARFLTAIADEIDALDENFLQQAHLETALPLPRLQGERPVPAVSCAYSPGYWPAVIRKMSVSIRLFPIAGLCPGRICASISWPSALWRYSAPVISRWRFPPPAAIPLPPWRPVARLCSKRTAAIRPPPRASPWPSSAHGWRKTSRRACST